MNHSKINSSRQYAKFESYRVSKSNPLDEKTFFINSSGKGSINASEEVKRFQVNNLGLTKPYKSNDIRKALETQAEKLLDARERSIFSKYKSNYF